MEFIEKHTVMAVVFAELVRLHGFKVLCWLTLSVFPFVEGVHIGQDVAGEEEEDKGQEPMERSRKPHLAPTVKPFGLCFAFVVTRRSTQLDAQKRLVRPVTFWFLGPISFLSVPPENHCRSIVALATSGNIIAVCGFSS